MICNALERVLRLGSDEAGEIYADHIHANDQVVVVGPSVSPFLDPTLLFVASRLGLKRDVFIADPQSGKIHSLEERMEARDTAGGIAGVGNVTLYTRELEVMRDCGLSLATPIWLGSQSGVHNIPLVDGSVDRIVDHNTSVFVAGCESGHAHFLDTLDHMDKTLHEYRRVLKYGGTVMLQTDARDWHVGEYTLDRVLPDLMRDHGFSLQHVHVRDVFTIVFPQDVFDRYILRVSGLINFGAYHNGRLRIRVGEYGSPDLYIAVKRQ